MLSRHCQDFRDDRLARDDAAGSASVRSGHEERCDACRLWLRSLERRVTLLRGMRRPTAPTVLEAMVVEVLEREESFDPRVAHVLGALPALAAPRALATRIERDLLDEPAVAGVLRHLEMQRAPDVLERLVREEVDDPAAARARRFAGDLEPVGAPTRLTRRVALELGRLVSRRRAVGSLVALAAAAVVLWIGVRRTVVPPQPRYSFVVRHADSTAALGGLARVLGESLSGGVSNAVAPPPGWPEGVEGGEVR